MLLFFIWLVFFCLLSLDVIIIAVDSALAAALAPLSLSHALYVCNQ